MIEMLCIPTFRNAIKYASIKIMQLTLTTNLVLNDMLIVLNLEAMIHLINANRHVLLKRKTTSTMDVKQCVRRKFTEFKISIQTMQNIITG